MINLVLFVLSGLGFSAGNEQVGLFITSKLGLSDSVSLPIVRFGIGFVVLTVILMCLGFLTGFHIWLLWLVWGIWVCLGILRVFSFRSLLSRNNVIVIESDSLVPWLKWGIFFILLLCFCTVLTPETRHDTFDYHLSIPNTYLAFGKIIEMPWHVFTYMPKNGETLYVLALGIGNDSLAKLIHFIFGCGCLAVIWAFVTSVFGQRQGWLSLFFVVTIPLFGFLATAAYVDLIRSFWELLALFTLYLAWEQKEPKQHIVLLVFSALFAGMAIGTKYTAWLIFLGPYLLLLFIILFFVFPKKPWWFSIILAFFLIAPVVPWLICNALWTGNPMYPFFPSIFGLNTPTALDAYQFIRGHAPETSVFKGFHLIQYVMQRIGNLLLEGNTIVVLGGLSLLLFPWLPRFFPKKKLPLKVFYGLAGFILLSFALFLVGSNNMDGRFCFTTIALLSIPLTITLSAIENTQKEEERWKTWILPGLIGLLFVNALWHRYLLLDNLDESIIPRITTAQREAFLTHHFPNYPMEQWANEHLPKDAFVLGMGYPVRRKEIYGTKHGYIPFLEIGKENPSTEHLARLLAKAGITHILKPYPRTQYKYDWQGLEKNNLVPVYTYRNMTLYRFIAPEDEEGI